MLLWGQGLSNDNVDHSSMPDKSSNATASDPLLEKSSLYQEFLAEREEIMRHKWLKSEEAGHDIGFDATLLDWVMKYRSDWKRERRANAAKQR